MTPQQTDPLSLILHAGPLVKFVLFLLLLMSVTSWGVIVFKWIIFRSALRQNAKFIRGFQEADNLEKLEKTANAYSESPAARVFLEGSFTIEQFIKVHSKRDGQMGLETLQRSIQKTISAEVSRLEKAVPYLATVGATSPFIGLFGTVWGIMNSFRNIGTTGAANLAVVAPGIAEALIATAAGLAAAIPAVMAYNFFVHRIRFFHTELDGFSADFMNLAKMTIFKGP